MRDNLEHFQWSKIKVKLSLKYPSLTEADLIWRYGTKNDLLEMIASKLDKTTQDLQAEVDNH